MTLNFTKIPSALWQKGWGKIRKQKRIEKKKTRRFKPSVFGLSIQGGERIGDKITGKFKESAWGKGGETVGRFI